MIREFALEPELVATWTDRPTCRFFRNELGLGTGRIVSRYPKRWRTLVYAAFQALHEPRPLADHEAAANQLRQTRLTELVQRLAEVMVQRRDHLWDSEFPWFDNACAEHQRRPFDAILARSATGGPPCTITDDSCEASNPTWHAPRSACVRRTPEDLAASVAMLLRSCSVAVFVDPHFGPENPRYRATFLRYFAALYSDRASGVWPRVGILTASDAEDGYYARECLDKLSPIIPVGAVVTVHRLLQQPGGEKLHNRYILTDLGGIIFGIGLDCGPKGNDSMDDLQILERTTYLKRFAQYSSPFPAFSTRGDPIVVLGSCSDQRHVGPGV